MRSPFALLFQATGWAVILTGAFTKTSASALVTLPATFATRTVYLPASAAFSSEMENVAPVAPKIAAPFLNHW